MNNKKSRLSHAIKAGIFTAGLIFSTQSQALSLIEPPVFDVAPEFPIAHEMMDDVFLTADNDGNQQLSVEEFYRLHAAATMLEYEMTFKRMDKDSSGEVDSEEFSSFLPVEKNDVLKEQFLNAAGEDELLDVKEFSLMRMRAQDNSESLLWRFAMMDHDHDGELTPAEFYGLPFIEPPVILPPPEVIDPPIIIDPPILIEPPIIIDPLPPEIIIEPVEPVGPVMPEPEIIIEPIKPPAPPIKPEPETPEEETEETNETIEQTSPPESDSELLEKIDELTQKIAVLEKRMARIEKSISRTKEKMEQTNSDRKASRLERRLKRQVERLNNIMLNHEETMMKLQEAQQMPAS